MKAQAGSQVPSFLWCIESVIVRQWGKMNIVPYCLNDGVLQYEFLGAAIAVDHPAGHALVLGVLAAAGIGAGFPLVTASPPIGM